MSDQLDKQAIKHRIIEALERRLHRRRGDAPVRPLPAIVIARRFGIRPRGSRDSRRRGVRLLIEQLRADGHPILMSDRGYHLPATAADFDAAERYARRNGLGHLTLAATFRSHPAHADATGQLSMFPDPPTDRPRQNARPSGRRRRKPTPTD